MTSNGANWFEDIQKRMDSTGNFIAFRLFDNSLYNPLKGKQSD